MDADRLDLVRHLFALATAIAEDAHDVAAAGQGESGTGVTGARAAADRLQFHATRLRDIARAIAVVAEMDGDTRDAGDGSSGE